MKNRKTRFIGIIAMVVMVAVMLMPVGVQAASQKSMAIQAYKKFLSNATIPWEDDWNVRASRCWFALAYIDNNNVPELIVSNSLDVPHAGGHGRIFTYKNGKVRRIVNLYMDNSKFSYYKKKGIYADSYVQGGVTNTYYKLSGITKTKKLSIFKNVARLAWLPKGTSYYDISGAANVKISKKTFNKKLKKMVGSKKMTNVSLKKNTSSNRKRYLK